MVIFNCLLRRIRRPYRLIPLLGLVFVGLGTFYWELWEIPWLSDLLLDDDSSAPTNPWGIANTEYGSEAPLRPERLACVDDGSRILLPRSRYCAWNNTLQDCYETLMPVFHKKQSWIFLGDENIANIPYYLSLQWPANNTLKVLTRRNPCQNLVYYGLPPPDTGWRQPDPQLGEGPIGIGLQRHFCTDCRNCWNIAMESAGSGTQSSSDVGHAVSVEYLVVEYARDVSLPSRWTNTTQQTVTHYLNQKKSSPSVCVATAGLNDAAIQPPISQEVYLQNVDNYLDQLQRTCDSVIWIGLNAVVEGGNQVLQSNCRLRKWNDGLRKLLEARNYEKLYFIDIFDQSFHTDFDSPTRPGKKFYASLSRLFKALIAGPDLVE